MNPHAGKNFKNADKALNQAKKYVISKERTNYKRQCYEPSPKKRMNEVETYYMFANLTACFFRNENLSLDKKRKFVLSRFSGSTNTWSSVQSKNN